MDETLLTNKEEAELIEDLLKDDKQVIDEDEEIISDQDEEVKISKKEKVSDDDENKDEEEIKIEDEEDEEEEPDETKLELVIPVRRQEILAKYPKLFKDFPFLEKAYYREQKYTEILPTIEDAKEAVERSELLGKFEGELFSGKTEGILKSVKDANPQAFGKMVDDYLPALFRTEEKAYYHVIGNVLRDTIKTMVDEGARTGNDEVKAAAVILHQMAFGNTDFKSSRNFSEDIPKQDNSLEREKKEFFVQKLNSVTSELQEKTSNVLKGTIDKNIDPKDQMSGYVKKNAVKDCMNEVEKAINEDGRFRLILDKLWEKAIKNNYNRSDLDNIRSAYLGKAKAVLPTVIQRIRNEALRGQKLRVVEDNKKVSTTGNSSSQTKKQIKGKPPGMTMQEFFAQD